MGVDPQQHCSRIRHTGQIRGNVDRVCAQKGDDEDEQQPAWKPLFEVSGQPFSRYLSDAGTHHLNRGHQRPGDERGP
jgi:hypothetical protein